MGGEIPTRCPRFAGVTATLALALLAAPALAGSLKAGDRADAAQSQQGRVITDSDSNEAQSAHPAQGIRSAPRDLAPIPEEASRANRHQALSHETLNRIPEHSPEWTDHYPFMVPVICADSREAYANRSP